MEDLTDAFKWRKGPSTVQPSQIELEIAKKAFGEGMAHWGAYETSKILVGTGVFTREDILDFDYSIRYDYHQGETRDTYVDRLREALQIRFNDLIASLSEGSLSASKNAMNSWNEIQRLSYLVGYVFVREVMEDQR